MNLNTDIGVEPAGSAELVLPADASLGLVADRLVDQARADGVALTGDGGLLTGLIQRVLQGALDAEITDYLGMSLTLWRGAGRGTRATGSIRKLCERRSAMSAWRCAGP